eukprot:CAMPEP_0181303478 /NCGR_PEP_ID=MMETSP1101-20121128/8581_1 /TAXON_ID=46948 /ORGANISM="Rhodomonas abbreviata, Strain Caron Lab Isolate" /LENGTH=181 /DNA_ID=CAMNT_0023409057 /DNA_START=100 /DNA_END=645 /DNA_ORIENTATION=+
MGLFLSKVANIFNNTKDARIVLVGLDAAGKTTVLYKFKLNETVNTIPTIGFNVEEVQYKNINFLMWDVGGQEKIRPLWKHYYRGCHAVIFMVDSVDQDRFDEARKELQLIVNDDELRNAAVLVLANKQDLAGAAPVDQIAKAMGLLNLPSTRKWHVHATNAVTGEGLYEGLDWLAAELPKA